MKALLVITNAVSALMTIVALIFVLRGIVILIAGKCRLRGYLLKAKPARLVGLVFILAPICAFLLWGMIYESLDWGSRGPYAMENAIKSITSALVSSVLLIIAIAGSYIWAWTKSKAHKLAEDSQQIAPKPTS